MKWSSTEFNEVEMAALDAEVKAISQHPLMREALWLQKQGAVKIAKYYERKNVRWCTYKVKYAGEADFSRYFGCINKLNQLSAYRDWKGRDSQKRTDPYEN